MAGRLGVRSLPGQQLARAGVISGEAAGNVKNGMASLSPINPSTVAASAARGRIRASQARQPEEESPSDLAGPYCG